MMTANRIKVAIIEDEKVFSTSLKRELQRCSTSKNIDMSISIVDTEEKVHQLFSAHDSFDIGFFDLNLNDKLVGVDLLANYSKKTTYPVILSSFYTDKDIVKRSYVAGGMDFLKKPFSKKAIGDIIDKYLTLNNDDYLSDQIYSKFITEDVETIAELEQLKKLDVTDGAVHLSGPTGTGKQVVAELIKEIYFDEDAPFVEVNCASLTEEFFVSQLFGHNKGSYTGSEKSKKGDMLLANGGILFLDEVDKMPVSVQVKFLKAVEQKKFKPLGSEKEIHSEFLVVSASSKDLNRLVAQDKFIIDLVGRLCHTEIKLKPLKERKSDVPLLINHFMNCHKSGRVFLIEDDAMKRLQNYSWKTNIRELKKRVDKWQREGVKVLTASHLQDMVIKEIQNSYDLLDKKMIKQIDEIGIPKALDKLCCEIFDFYYNKTAGKYRRMLRETGIASRFYYKYRDMAETILGTRYEKRK